MGLGILKETEGSNGSMCLTSARNMINKVPWICELALNPEDSNIETFTESLTRQKLSVEDLLEHLKE